MRKRLSRSRVACAVVVAATLVAPVIGAQLVSGQAARWTPPRTPDGQPDIQGMWQRYGVGTRERDVTYPDVNAANERPYPDLWLNGPPTKDRQERRERIRSRPTGIIDPPSGRLPWRVEGEARRNQIMKLMLDAPSLEYVDPIIRCMLPGVPRSGPGGYRILQARDKVVIFYEFNHINRIIPLDGRPHVGPNIRLFMGDSRGHWEGNTLVVDTTNFTGQTWYDMVGTPQSDALHVIERFTVVDADLIDYEITIDDPKLFTRPWKTAGGFYRAEDGYEPFEYACAEGTRFQLENNLRK